MVRTLALALALAASPVALAADVEPPAFGEAVGDYSVGARDVLSIEVYGEKDLSGKWTVRADGAIVYPYLGTVALGGLTTTQIGTLLAERLRDGYLVDPHVSVEVIEHRSQSVKVFGAVKKTGEYYLEGPSTLLDLLAWAGNVDAEKAVREVRVSRQDGTEVVIALDRLVRTGDGNLVLRDGDVVNIPEGQFVYVAGEVAKPGAIVFQDGLTAVQALTKAGGPAQTAQLRGAYILRDGERIPINLKRMLDGREADVTLMPGDQLFLKESPI